MQLAQRPLDLVLLGSLHPAVAQMLGLYWRDAAVAPGQAFDYLLLADHDGSLGGTAASALAWLVTPDWDVVDGFVAFNKRLAAAAPLAAPARPRAYSLPGRRWPWTAAMSCSTRRTTPGSCGAAR